MKDNQIKLKVQVEKQGCVVFANLSPRRRKMSDGKLHHIITTSNEGQAYDPSWAAYILGRCRTIFGNGRIVNAE